MRDREEHKMSTNLIIFDSNSAPILRIGILNNMKCFFFIQGTIMYHFEIITPVVFIRERKITHKVGLETLQGEKTKK